MGSSKSLPQFSVMVVVYNGRIEICTTCRKRTRLVQRKVHIPIVKIVRKIAGDRWKGSTRGLITCLHLRGWRFDTLATKMLYKRLLESIRYTVPTLSPVRLKLTAQGWQYVNFSSNTKVHGTPYK